MQWWTVKQLRSRNASTRLSAATKLGRQGGNAVVGPLTEALTDADAAVRASAAEALGQLQNEDAAGALAAQLKDPVPEVRRAAAKALQQIGSQSAVSCLVVTLGDPMGEVAWQAAQALKVLGWQPAEDAERAAWHLALGQFDDAASLGTAAVEPLGRIARGAAFHRAVRAVEALSTMGGPPAVKILLECLRGNDSTLRASAASALGQVGDARAVEPLLQALRDQNPHVALAACGSLSKLGDQRAIDPLIRLLEHRNDELRAAALDALGSLRDPRVVPPAISLLQDPDKEVRESAARTLGRLGDEAAVEHLVVALTDPESSVRQAMSRALRLIEPYWERSDAALRAIPGLQLALKNKDYWVRYTAADILNKLGTAQPRALPLVTETDHALQKKQAAAGILISLLDDPDRDFRQAAAEALGRLSLIDTIPALSARLFDSDRGVQLAAARALESLRWRPRSRSDLAAQLVLLEKWPEAAALGAAAIPAFSSCLNWGEPLSRRRGIEVLVQIGGPEAGEALHLLAAGDDPIVREEALAALKALETPIELNRNLQANE